MVHGLLDTYTQLKPFRGRSGESLGKIMNPHVVHDFCSVKGLWVSCERFVSALWMLRVLCERSVSALWVLFECCQCLKLHFRASLKFVIRLMKYWDFHESIWRWSESALKVLWMCSECALKVLGRCSESALEVLWKCSGGALKVLWSCLESAWSDRVVRDVSCRDRLVHVSQLLQKG